LASAPSAAGFDEIGRDGAARRNVSVDLAKDTSA
jgi:hypothetical protein